MKGTNAAVTWFGAAGAFLTFLGVAVAGKYGLYIAAVGGACNATAFFLSKGKNVTGGDIQQ
jgi:hypothetical protein